MNDPVLIIASLGAGVVIGIYYSASMLYLLKFIKE